MFDPDRSLVGEGNRAGRMEKELHARDKVGVQDFVLLEDYTNIDAFIDNLDRRFKEDLIYVSRQPTGTDGGGREGGTGV